MYPTTGAGRPGNEATAGRGRGRGGGYKAEKSHSQTLNKGAGNWSDYTLNPVPEFLSSSPAFVTYFTA